MKKTSTFLLSALIVTLFYSNNVQSQDDPFFVVKNPYININMLDSFIYLQPIAVRQQLDFTSMSYITNGKVENTLNSNGHYTRREEFNWNTSTSMFETTSKLEANHSYAGMQLSTTNFKHINMGATNLRRNTAYTYDSQNRIELMLHNDSMSISANATVKDSLVYDANGNWTQRYLFVDTNSTGNFVLTQLEVFTYNTLNQLIEMHETEYANSAVIHISKTNLSYDMNGYVSEVVDSVYNTFTMSFDFDEKTVFVNDAQGNVTERIDYYADNSGPTIVPLEDERYLYTYHADGRINEMFFEDWDGTAWEKTSKYTMVYTTATNIKFELNQYVWSSSLNNYAPFVISRVLFYEPTLNPPTAPIAPSNFVATASGAGLAINLSWDVNSTNELGFFIQRGLDTLSFANIDTVFSGTVSTVDSTVMANTVYFYRVGAFNFDGTSYSNIDSAIVIAITTNEVEFATSLKLFPNPVNNGNLTISSLSAKEDVMRVNIIDITGKSVYTTQYTMNKGFTNQNIQLDLSSGIYIATFETSQLRKTEKIIIK
jgi:hypothetical protein